MNAAYAIFDMDGTLLDSMHVWRQLASLYLTSKGMEPPPGISERVWEMSIREAAVLFQTMGLCQPVEEIEAEINLIPREWYQNRVLLKPGARAFLDGLLRQGTRLCIETATERTCAEAALRRVGILGCFDFLLTCGEVGRGKDNPEIYLQCARRFGASPQEIVVFEDSLYCVRTARAAGFRVVGVQDRFSKGDEAQIRALTEAFLDFGRA